MYQIEAILASISIPKGKTRHVPSLQKVRDGYSIELADRLEVHAVGGEDVLVDLEVLGVEGKRVTATLAELRKTELGTE
jgi:hypothetical protein